MASLQTNLGVNVVHIDITNPEALKQTLAPGNKWVSFSLDFSRVYHRVMNSSLIEQSQHGFA